MSLGCFTADIDIFTNKVTVSGGTGFVPPDGYSVRDVGTRCFETRDIAADQELTSHVFFELGGNISQKSFSTYSCFPHDRRGILDRWHDFSSVGCNVVFRQIPLKYGVVKGEKRFVFPALTIKYTPMVFSELSKKLKEKNTREYPEITCEKKKRGSGYIFGSRTGDNRFWMILAMSEYAGILISQGQRMEWGNIVSVPDTKYVRETLDNMLSSCASMFMGFSEKLSDPLKDAIETTKEIDDENNALVDSVMKGKTNPAESTDGKPNADSSLMTRVAQQVIRKRAETEPDIDCSFV